MCNSFNEKKSTVTMPPPPPSPQREKNPQKLLHFCKIAITDP